MRQLLGAIAGIVLSFASANANSIVIDTLNSPIAFTISGDIGNGIVLTATGTVTITDGFDSSLLELHVILNNESTLDGSPYTPSSGVQLIGWGFGIDPNVTGVSFENSPVGGMIDAKAESIPDLSGIEVCAWGGNSCTGNSADGGILAGGNDSFDLRLDGRWGQSVTFDPIGARFRTADGNTFSYECSGSCSVQSLALAAAAVPEPDTLGLLGLALLGMGVARLRRHPRLLTSTRN